MMRFLWIALLILTACTTAHLPARDTPVTSPSPTNTYMPTPTVTPTVEPSATRPATPTAQVLPTKAFDIPSPQPETQEPPSTTLLDEFLPKRKLEAETEHFRFYSQDDYFPVDQAWWIEQAEVVYDYVSERLDGAQVKNKVELAFLKPDERACPVRGLASHERTPQVLVYADEEMPREYLQGVLAHELGHAIPSEGFPDGLPDELALTEGLATWASGKYWDAWKDVGSLHELVQGYVEAGDYEPLHENLALQGIYPWQEDTGPGCLDRRDRLYGQWGSFLGYLIEQYGWDKAQSLFVNRVETRRNQRIEYPPDFESIYGKALNQLEVEWLDWLNLNHSSKSG